MSGAAPNPPPGPLRPSGPNPPSLWSRLLAACARRLGTPELAADAAELFRHRARRDGAPAARRWYRRQALAAVGALLASTLRLRRRRHARAGRALPRRGASGVSLLDFKLGLRMLVRHPGLTLVAGAAMAFAIMVGAVDFEFLKDAMYPSLPLDDGDRVVRLQVVDSRLGNPTGVHPADWAAWRKELRSVRPVGAFHGIGRTLGVGEGPVLPVEGVATTASAFEVARIAPALGRPLVAADEAPGAPPVVVLGHDLWRSAFAGDPRVVDRTVRLGDAQVTVVGVMPAEFSFPTRADVLVPLRVDELVARDAAGEKVPPVLGFGRLAPGVTREAAGAELRSLGAGRAEPDMAEHLTPAVEPFAYPILSGDGIATSTVFLLMAGFVIMLMVVVCANVALLLFARAATREEELAVRAALGAGRRRIVAQLFVEALVLAGVSLVAGLWAASAVLGWVMRIADASGDLFPFWIGETLSPTTVAWTCLLALLGAGIAGVIPGLKVTGQDLQASLQRAAGRGSGIRLGRLWNGVIVGQVALTVIFMPVALITGLEVRDVATRQPAVAEEEFLVAELEAEGDAGSFREAHEELRSRLATEPWVRATAVAGRPWPGWRWSGSLEVEDLPLPDERSARTSQHMEVGPDFFDAMGAPLVTGRWLGAGDVDGDPPVVMVDEAFVDRVLGGRSAVGRRIRIGDRDEAGGPNPTDTGVEEWREIVGVVGDLGLNPFLGERYRGVIYYPLSTADATELALFVRVAGDPAGFTTRLRVLALGVDPPLTLRSPEALAYRRDRPVREYGAWFRLYTAAGAVALLLTLAGIYAVMAYTVSRRTREIGVRIALGAGPGRVAGVVLSRAATQVGYGILAAAVIIPLLMLAVYRTVEDPPIPSPGVSAVLLVAYLVIMTATCLLACIVPMRRALRIEPSEALAAEA